MTAASGAGTSATVRPGAATSGAHRIAVVQFPGTNCARETALALARAGLEPVSFLWNGDRELLRSLDGYVLAGGFSYEDRSRSGVIAALDPVMSVILQENERGKPVLGICNGAQMLVETGLVPGVALTTNRRVAEGRVLGTGFYNAWVTLRVEPPASGAASGAAGVFTGALQPGELIRIPAAHAEGRFVLTEDALRRVEELGLVAFRYADAAGRVVPEFPVNPNGSTANIAALTNEAGTAMAIMPHPERTPAGDGIFRSLRTYLKSSEPKRPGSSRRESTPPVTLAELPPHRTGSDAEQILVELIITDNAAVSVENALDQRGIAASIRRREHWELTLDAGLSAPERQDLLERIHATGELYNANKERLVSPAASRAAAPGSPPAASTSPAACISPPGSLPASPPASPPAGGDDPSLTLLVRERDDVIGPERQQALQDWFDCGGIASIRHGVLWTITPARAVNAVLATSILMNPVSQECFQYA